MRPYHQEEHITLYQGDCLEVMAHLEPGSVDAVIADPPYGTTACAWDTVIPFAPMWAALRRLVRPRAPIVLFGSQPFTSALVMSNPGMFKYQWVWNKNNSAGFMTANHRPFVITEDICVFGSGAVNYYPQMTKGQYRTKGYGGKISPVYNVIPPAKGLKNDAYYPKNILEITKVNSDNTDHPTQKPLALLSYLILTYTNPGDTVLDFTVGSGTTLRAAKNLGRKAIGIEIDEHFCSVAARRLQQEVMAL